MQLKVSLKLALEMFKYEHQEGSVQMHWPRVFSNLPKEIRNALTDPNHPDNVAHNKHRCLPGKDYYYDFPNLDFWYNS